MEDQVTCPTDCAAVEISAGPRHTCVRLADGTLRCWGANDHGQLGDGTTTGRNFPAAVADVGGAVDVSAGGGLSAPSCGPSPCYAGHSPHSCAVLADGTARCWGANRDGQLGDGTTMEASLPVSVLGLTHATTVASGAGHSCALRADGTIACWGPNNVGQLGDGTNVASAVPVDVAGPTRALDLAAGGDESGSSGHSCVGATDGTVWCWGNLSSWGSIPGPGVAPLPALFPGLSAVAAISTGARHDCALLRDRTVVCWGANTDGQLGDGGPFPTPGVPIRVAAW